MRHLASPFDSSSDSHSSKRFSSAGARPSTFGNKRPASILGVGVEGPRADELQIAIVLEDRRRRQRPAEASGVSWT
jgi:hypothetical protein